MARKKKEKKTQEEIPEGYRYETPWEIFVRNYREVPGVRIIVKLALYFLFFTILVVAMSASINSGKMNRKKTTTTTTTTAQVIKFSDMLNELLGKKEYKCEININGNEYVLNGSYGNSILVGNLYTNEGTYAFKIQDDKVYEVTLKDKQENSKLLKDIDKSIIFNDSLVNAITNSSGIKVENGYKYNKVDINKNTYSMEIIVVNNHIKNINLTNDTISYKFTYDETFNID